MPALVDTINKHARKVTMKRDVYVELLEEREETDRFYVHSSRNCVFPADLSPPMDQSIWVLLLGKFDGLSVYKFSWGLVVRVGDNEEGAVNQALGEAGVSFRSRFALNSLFAAVTSC